MHGLFVTGTGTHVGKTWISCLIARQLHEDGVFVGAYKPACSGSESDAGGVYWPDVRALESALGHRFPAERVCPQTFNAPLAPPEAARKEGRAVDTALMAGGLNWWQEQVEFLIVEGVGGLLCPVTPDSVIADFALETGYPVLIVAHAGLGTINHTLLTVEAARGRGLQVAGVVLNQTRDVSLEPDFVAANARQIRDFGDVPVLALCPFAATALLDVETHETARPDWFSLGSCAE